jgi:opacity protein-like surface antigen
LPSSAAFEAFPVACNTGGSSVIGGFQAGYNRQFAPTWVVGIEGDWSWTKAGGNVNQPWVTNPGGATVPGSFTTMSSTSDWVSSLRARLGYLVLPNLMVYGTAGGAWGKVDYAASNFAPTGPAYATSAAFSSIQGGWVAGGGPRMDDHEQLAAARRISLLRAQQLAIRGGRRSQRAGISVGIFVEQHQCERGAGGAEL